MAIQCPICHGQAVRYTFRTRDGSTRIALLCEACEHVGPEIPLTHMHDTNAALTAVRAWETGSAIRRFVVSGPRSIQ